MTYRIGFIGLGRMGSNMVLNLLDKSYKIVGYDTNHDSVRELEKHGMTGSYSLEQLVSNLATPRINWLMVPSGTVDDVLKGLVPLLRKGDIVVDGGNSYFEDSIKRYRKLKKKGIHFLDVGTSGGIEGARHGACMMIGGDKEVFEEIEQLFRDMAIRYGYVGSSGAGHFVKMVHNAIEYGMMGAIAEGLDAIKKYARRFNMDPKKVAEVYARGTIIEGKLMDWLVAGMSKPYFESLSGVVPRGETEEEMEKLESLADMPILHKARLMRVETRREPSFKGKVISTLRREFGGHSTK